MFNDPTFVMNAILAISVSAIIVHSIKVWRYRKSVAELSEEIYEDLMAQFEAHVIRAFAEKHNGTIYLYDLESSTFICRGQTIEELAKAFSVRYPDKIVSVDEGPEEILNEINAYHEVNYGN